MWGSHVVPPQLRWFLLAAGLLVLASGVLSMLGCSQEDVSGRLSCVLYEEQVECDSQGCVAPDGGVAVEVPVEATQVVISSEASRFQPDGVYVYAELAAPEAALGVLELDVPRRNAGVPYASYEEWRGTEQVFHAARTAGTITVAPVGDQRGRFLLRLDDPGPDGVLGTDDDLTRVLASGEYGPSAAASLTAEPLPTPLPPGDDDGAVVIDVIDLILDGADLASSPPVDDPGGSDGSESGCGGEDVSQSDPGCDGSGSTSGDASGCDGSGGDSGGCEGGGGGSGCEGDVGGGGCEGDVGGGGCTPDATRNGTPPAGTDATPGSRRQRHVRGPQRMAPLFLVGGVGVWWRRARRRRRGG
jgi:hypothetical protein